MTPEEKINEIREKSRNMARPVYRGQANACWELESGAVYRLRKANEKSKGQNFPEDDGSLRQLLKRYHDEILLEPKRVIDGDASQNLLQKLSILQHQGAATGLLDFTESPLVALWFACKDEPEKDAKAKVFMFDIYNTQIAKNGTNLEDPFDAGHYLVYYEPDHSLGTRIVAQKSVFVIVNTIEYLESLEPSYQIKSVEIPQSSKIELLEYLESLGYSETSLFKDIPGLAMANTRNIPLQPEQLKPVEPQEYRHKGNLAYQNGRFEDALLAYEAYAKELPNVAQPYCLKGDTLAALARFEDADLAYTMATERLDKPIDFGKEVIVNLDVVVPMMSRSLYYNRGNVRAAVDKHEDAIKDFESAIELGFKPKYRVLTNLGNSKFALQKFKEAYLDFEEASLERRTSDLALAMGNCKVMMGKFEDALVHYYNGISTRSEQTTTEHCRANAKQVGQIIKVLNGQKFKLRRERYVLLVEAADVQGNLCNFTFVGNKGNTGNSLSGMIEGPGGEGYEGMEVFVVKIVDSIS